ncbi:MAG: hypothetical protein KDB53_01910, partial [Planctomycetes bacterium]|nr:hypothetical protein [Planctomycetota bacterium]
SLEPWAAKGASQTASKAHAVIQAALLGTVDVDRLRADLVGHDTGRKLAALQLIEASGHGGFRTELLALIKTAQTSSLPATRLLASLFREDARDELQALREGGSEDSWARYALDELDAFEVRRRALDD